MGEKRVNLYEEEKNETKKRKHEKSQREFKKKTVQSTMAHAEQNICNGVRCTVYSVYNDNELASRRTCG